MIRLRKKPLTVNAIQWTGENLDAVLAFCEGNAHYEIGSSGRGLLVIRTLEDGPNGEAQHAASLMDWVIKDVKGEFYFCKPDILAITYEDESASGDVAGEKLAAIQAEVESMVHESDCAKWQIDTEGNDYLCEQIDCDCARGRVLKMAGGE